jgi:predicted ATPase/DNA-binding XRE family transcriptional regulator
MAAGFSQEHLARLARISVESVGALERGTRRAPHRETVQLIAEALRLDEPDRAQLEAVADGARSRGRRSTVAPTPPPPTSQLPLQSTSFVGRARELTEIASLLGSSRLVTITGSGGVGKTRASLEVAERVAAAGRQDVYFVDLSPISDSSFVVATIAKRLGLTTSGALDSIGDLVAAMQPKRALIVLDNCEHLIANIAELVAASLRGCPQISYLATSRERLAVHGEIVYRLPSLEMPAHDIVDIDKARRYAALDLFMQRATMVDPFFQFTSANVPGMVGICSRLDGIPLAIELAAARVPMLGIEALNERLKQGLRLGGGARNLPARQQTMLATIGWSYDLLSDAERLLLERTAIFVGGFTLAAAESVCAGESIASDAVAELLSSLVDKSLLGVTHSEGRARYSILESVRVFAYERVVAAGYADEIALRHARWLARFADDIEATRVGKSEPWLRAETAPELENVRAALSWAFRVRSRESTVLAARIIGGLRTIWLVSDRHRECLRWVHAALAEIDEERDAQLAAPLMRALVQAAGERDIFRWGTRVLGVFERVGDRVAMGIVHSQLATQLSRRGRCDEADVEMSRACDIFASAPRSMPYRALLQFRYQLHLLRGRYEDALSDIAEAIAIVNSVGDAEAYLWHLFRAEVHFAMGHRADAIRATEEILAKILLDQQTFSREIVIAYTHLARFRLTDADVPAAAAATCEVLRRLRRGDNELSIARVLHLAAMIAVLRGELRLATHLWWHVDTTYDPDVGRHWRELDVLLIPVSLRTRVADDLEALRLEGPSVTRDALIGEALETLANE